MVEYELNILNKGGDSFAQIRKDPFSRAPYTFKLHPYETHHLKPMDEITMFLFPP